MKKLLIILAIIIAIFATSIYTLPATLTKITEKTLSETLQTEVKVKKIDLSLVNSEFTVEQLEIKDYPKFSDKNLFILNNLVFSLEPTSLFSNVITIKELTIAGIQLNLKGSLNDNSLKELQNILNANNTLEKQKEEEHKKIAAENNTTHNHAQHELRLKIKQININDISLTAKVTSPFELPEKQLKLNGLNISNIGGDKGINVNNVLKDITESLDIAVSQKVAESVPAQKVYEDAQKALDKGFDSSKKFLKESFSEQNIEEGKQKANELLNKLF